MIKRDKILPSLEKSFEISLKRMRKMIKDFHAEMENGLSGKKSSLKMIHTCVTIPTGNEKGKFIALDLGGTNFRVLEVELMGNGRISVNKAQKFILNKKYIAGRGEDLFDFVARCIKVFMKKEKISSDSEIRLGFTFSFPVEQRGIASGRLLRWTKGFNVTGVIDKDVVKLLEEAIAREGICNVKVSALANDTVGTMVTRRYEDRNCDVGVIIGTGTNACYVEDDMIINIEWGNFNRLKRTSYDIRLDKESTNIGSQILEKMVSGMYLGEISRLVFNDLIRKKMVFGKKYCVTAEDMSGIENDSSGGLSKTGILLKKLGVSKSTLDERRLFKKICEMVTARASRIIAAAIAAVVTKNDSNLFKKHIVAIDGSLYEKHPHFSKNIISALREIFVKKAHRIGMALTKDGSGKGAAVIAAIAAKVEEDAEE